MFNFTAKSKLLAATVATAVALFWCTGSDPAAQSTAARSQSSASQTAAQQSTAPRTAARPQTLAPRISPAVRVASETKLASTDTRSQDTSPGSSEGLIEGFTEPYADIDLAAGEMGILAEVLVNDGDEVVAGQLLAKLNDDVLTASLDVAESAMTATGELQSAQTQFDLKQVEAGKLKDLFGRDHASQKELDRVAGEVKIAQSRVVSVKEDLAVRRLEHARIKAQINQRQIRSTIDGVVVEVRKDKGEFVSPSDPVVARVVQLDPLLVVFSVPNVNRDSIHKDQPVSIKIAGSGIADGVVEHVSPTADASSGTFKVKVLLPNPDRRWHGGEKTELLLNSNNQTKQLARNSK